MIDCEWNSDVDTNRTGGNKNHVLVTNDHDAGTYSEHCRV